MRRQASRRPSGLPSFRPTLERLEDRLAPAVYTAANTTDLINDINAANTAGGSNTINLTGTTYQLSSVNNNWYGPNALPAITSNLTIDGN